MKLDYFHTPFLSIREKEKQGSDMEGGKRGCKEIDQMDWKMVSKVNHVPY